MKLRSKIFIAGGVSLAVLGGGAAFAFFTGGGSGTGAVSVASPSAFTVTVGDPAALLPDVSTPIPITVSNSTGATLQLNSVTVTITSVEPSVIGACTTADFALTQPSFGAGPIGNGGSFNVPGGAITLVNNPTVNQDGCRNAIVRFSAVAG